MNFKYPENMSICHESAKNIFTKLCQRLSNITFSECFDIQKRHFLALQDCFYFRGHINLCEGAEK